MCIMLSFFVVSLDIILVYLYNLRKDDYDFFEDNLDWRWGFIAQKKLAPIFLSEFGCGSLTNAG